MTFRALSTSRRCTIQQTWVAATAVWSLVMLFLCGSFGVRHDYGNYIGQWQLLLDNVNPWSTDNTYGPLYTVVGFMLPWGKLAPKFFMVGVLLVANAAFVLELMHKRGVEPIQTVYFLSVPTNVLVVAWA